MSIKSRISGYLYSKFFKDYVERSIENKLRSYSIDQLFLDVANFIVFNQILGDYLEFGVYAGDSVAKMYHCIQTQWKAYQSHAQRYGNECDNESFACMRFFAFDSFEGLPGSSKEDTPIHFRKKGIYKEPKERFLENLKGKKVDLSKVVVIPGWFETTLKEEIKNQHKLTRASIIFIDCDLYESAVPVFNFVTSLIQDGTVIIIDDYFRYKGHPTKGIQKAFKEWLADNPSLDVSELTRCSANRVSFICYRHPDR